MTDLEQFKRDRTDALLSLDPAKIRAYLAKYGETAAPDPHVFMVGVHKAITGCRDLPLAARQASKAWLTERYYSSCDDGELT